MTFSIEFVPRLLSSFFGSMGPRQPAPDRSMASIHARNLNRFDEAQVICGAFGNDDVVDRDHVAHGSAHGLQRQQQDSIESDLLGDVDLDDGRVLATDHHQADKNEGTKQRRQGTSFEPLEHYRSA